MGRMLRYRRTTPPPPRGVQLRPPPGPASLHIGCHCIGARVPGWPIVQLARATSPGQMALADECDAMLGSHLC